jgi:aryl-alcohol dehydrogenase-like predicted oxidoreductase
MDEVEKIFIGSANFGENYGAIVKGNVLTEESIKMLLYKAIESPNLFIDTANSYKNSEYLIGKYAAQKLNNKIMTKVHISKLDNYKSIVNLIKSSLGLVQQDIFFSILIHNAEVFSGENSDEIVGALEDCKSNGLTQNIGVSCYEANEITFISSKYESLSDFQIPENVIDQRNLDNKDFRDLHKSGKSIYIRSVFLQGSLLTDPLKLPHFFSPELEVFEKFRQSCKANKISSLKACLDYVRNIDWKSGLVIGVQSYNQLNEILNELTNPVEIKTFSNQVLSSQLVDPRNWTRN